MFLAGEDIGLLVVGRRRPRADSGHGASRLGYRLGRRPTNRNGAVMPDTFTIAAVQMRMAPDTETNLAEGRGRHRRRREARGAGRLPAGAVHRATTSARRRTPRSSTWPSRSPGRATERLAAAAKENGVVVVGSLFEKRMPACTTTPPPSTTRRASCSACTARCTSRTTRCSSRSSTSPPATSASRCSTTPAAKVGTLVCWDQWYPEAARLTALQGAEVIFYPTAIGWHPKEKAEFGEAQHAAWETSMRGHAIANGTYVCAVNRVGHEVIVGEGLEFWGGSFVCDPFGRILKKASHRQGRDPGRDVRPEADGGRAPELAVLPRPAHRRVRRHHEARGGLDDSASGRRA